MQAWRFRGLAATGLGAPGNNEIWCLAPDTDQSADRAGCEVLGVVEDLNAPIGASSSASVWTLWLIRLGSIHAVALAN